jgi:(1->4)-alpha-D-glucan 1-alpha-D-glucosylmutase
LKNETDSQGRDASDLNWDFRRFDRIGIAKLFLIWRMLNFRRTNTELFTSSDYVPLAASGHKDKHICAFMRKSEGRTVIIVVPRLVPGLTGGREIPPLGSEIWNGTILPLPQARPGQVFINVITMEEAIVAKQGRSPALMVGDVLMSFPVALLEQQ